MNFAFSIFDWIQKSWDKAQDYVVPGLIVGLVFLGPVICKITARLTRSLKPWCIKSISLLAACGAMTSANLILYKWSGANFTSCAWLPDLLFVILILNWLRTPLLHLRAGSAEALDNKIEQRRTDGWNSTIFRWIPATGEHRTLLTKRSDREIPGGPARPAIPDVFPSPAAVLESK